MSKQNKVNKNHYDQAGRLTPDDLARERVKQGQMTGRAKSSPSRARFGEAGKEQVTGNVRKSSAAPESNRPRSEREAEE
jgi:hypothetical protein